MFMDSEGGRADGCVTEEDGKDRVSWRQMSHCDKP